MPSKSEAQRRLMEMCATPEGRRNAKGNCPPAKVAKEYRAADRAKARRERMGTGRDGRRWGK